MSDRDGAATAAVPDEPPPQRSDAGVVRMTERDINGLVWVGEMYGVPYDLLASLLAVNPGRLRAILTRWRRAGYAGTSRLGLGPGWAWLTKAGMAATGLPYTAGTPSLGRLRHIRAVAAVRLSLEHGTAYRSAGAYWRSERRIRARLGGRVGVRAHVPDAEVHWPAAAAAYGGELWGIEVELTAKALPRTVAIMREMLARTGDFQPGEAPPAELAGLARYTRLVYLASPQARPTVERAAGSLPGPLRSRVVVRDLPDRAVLP